MKRGRRKEEGERELQVAREGKKRREGLGMPLPLRPS